MIIRFYLLFVDPAPLQIGHHTRIQAPDDRRQIPNAFVTERYLQYVRRGDMEGGDTSSHTSLTKRDALHLTALWVGG